MGTNDVARFIPFDLWFDYHNPVGWSSFPVRIAYPVNGMGGSVVSQFARWHSLPALAGHYCVPWRWKSVCERLATSKHASDRGLEPFQVHQG